MSKLIYPTSLTSSVTANMVKNAAANDVFEYFLNLDTAAFLYLTEVEKNSNHHPKKSQISNDKSQINFKFQIPSEKWWEINVFRSL